LIRDTLTKTLNEVSFALKKNQTLYKNQVKAHQKYISELEARLIEHDIKISQLMSSLEDRTETRQIELA
jgi:hypothetical protein